MFFHSTFQFRFVSLVKCFVSQNTKHSKLTFARKSQFRETQNFAKQGADFREIRNSFRMKFSRFLYERNSSVNPRFNTLPKTLIKVVAKNCRKLLKLTFSLQLVSTGEDELEFFPQSCSGQRDKNLSLACRECLSPATQTIYFN